jgi:hypothetical protein
MPTARMLPDTAELRLMTGSEADQTPILEEPIEVRCLISPGLRRVETPGGQEEVSTMAAYCAADTPDVPTGSRFTHAGREWTVIRSLPWRFPGRPWLDSVELHLQ